MSITSYSTNKPTQTHSISRTRKKKKESRVSIFSKIEQPVRTVGQKFLRKRDMSREKNPAYSSQQ